MEPYTLNPIEPLKGPLVRNPLKEHGALGITDGRVPFRRSAAAPGSLQGPGGQCFLGFRDFRL